MAGAAGDAWWRRGLLYQVYVRSFADSDGDGVGDLRGVLERLDHLEWLGVEGIWLSPITVSPDDDWGYDVADYTAVQPGLGTLADFDRLVEEAGARGISVLLDLVPNHTSDRHPWFVESRAARDSPRRDWYVWADPKPDGSPPNNWLSTFGGRAWTLDPRTGQYYLHNFLYSQPDLDWWNEEVRDAFDAILRFWLDRGVAGFRIDVAHGLVKDRLLRDNPPGDRWRYNLNQPEVHDVYRRWRRIVDGYGPERILLGETWVLEPERLATFYGNGSDELHMAFNFAFVLADFDAAELDELVDAAERLLPVGGWPVWTLSNHDVVRFPTRWCDGDTRKVRTALLLLLGLRGTPVLYYGDELGLPQAELRPGEVRDLGRTRDGARTPMPWRPGPGGGFTRPGTEPWLPLGPRPGFSVEEQRADPASTLVLVRDLVVLRRSCSDLQDGDYERLEAPVGAWAWRRGEHHVVAVNLSDAPARLPDLAGEIVVATDRERDGSRFVGLELPPWSGVVART